MEQRKLLLADDSITIQKVINLTFADEGIEVTAVGNGAAAIEKLDEVKPDLVLADVHMPGLSGYEVCEKIRRTPGFENIPVMLLVGSFEPFDETEARRVGANDFLTKPFQSIKQLVSKVHLLLENADAQSKNDIAEETAAKSEDFSFTAQTPAAIENNSGFDFQSSPQNESRYSFGDAAFDDEMIHTSQRGSFDQTLRDFDVSSNESQESENEWHVIEATPVSDQPSNFQDYYNEPQNFDSARENNLADFEVRQYEAPTVELDSNLLNIQPADETENAEQSAQARESEDFLTFGETARETDFEFKAGNQEKTPTFSEEPPAQQNAAFEPDFEIENKFDLNTETEHTTASSQPAMEKPKSPFAELFDDDDLLGIEEEIRAEAAEHAQQTAHESAAADSAEAISPEVVTNDENQSQQLMPINQVNSLQKPGEMTFNFPPEVIDAIAARVVEKLSDKVIEKIAWEIVPDRFDLIVRKTIQDKDRDR